MSHQKMITVGDASELLGVSERQVRRYCTEGKLDSIRDGKAYSIEYASVVALLKQNEGLEQVEGGDTDSVSDTAGGLEQIVQTSDRIASDTSDTLESAVIEGDIPADILIETFPTDILIAVFKETADTLIKRIEMEHQRNKELEIGLISLAKGTKKPNQDDI